MLLDLGKSRSTNKAKYHNVLCSYCNIISEKRSDHLNQDSCGCRGSRYKHGHEQNRTKSPELGTWQKMKQRCYNKSNKDYHNYGGRGIYVSQEWLDDFLIFYTDMGSKPKGLSLDRIDVNGPYSKENCRWATSKVQNRNRRDNVHITLWNETHLLDDWYRILTASKTSYYRGLMRGLSHQDSLLYYYGIVYEKE